MKNSTVFKFLAISLLMCPLFSSAMNPTSLYELRRTGKEQEASDFKIYQLLSFAANNNPEFYLPTELVHAIAITACEITKAREIAEAIRAENIEAARLRMYYMGFLPSFA